MKLTNVIYWGAALCVFVGFIGMHNHPWVALIVTGFMAFIINFIGHMADLSDKR